MKSLILYLKLIKCFNIKIKNHFYNFQLFLNFKIWQLSVGHPVYENKKVLYDNKLVYFC